MLTLWVDERVRSLSHRGAVSYYSAGSIALENANDAGEVSCNKPEAQAKGIERYVFSNNLRLRFRLVSPVPADSDGKSGAPIQRCGISELSGSAVDAARRAGYPWPEQMSRKMLRNVEKRGVQAARLPLEPGGTSSKFSYRSHHAQRSG